VSAGARRRRLRRTLVLGPAAALLALAASAAAHGGHHHHRTTLRGPFATPAMAAFLKTRSGDITAAAFNLKTGRLFLYDPTLHGDDASIAKVDILATALYEAQQRGETLSPLERELAQGAIENSDNDDAEDMWELDGGNPGIVAFNARVGMTQTILDPEGAWGLYESTARDQIRLLEHLVRPNKVLSNPSRAYELDLMADVESDQAWGVSAGVLFPAKVALKNGWLPVGEGWEINSIGQIRGRFRDYLLAVLTSDDPDMPYGVETIEGIAGIVWKYFLPPRYQGGGGGHGS
jgi:hypothetical protein